MKYREKPVVIEANQWREKGDHTEVRAFRHPDDLESSPCKECGGGMRSHGWINTREGGHIVCPDDWIITGVQGEFYPIKAAIFKKTYEPADEAMS